MPSGMLCGSGLYESRYSPMNASVKLIETVAPTSVHIRTEVPEGHPSVPILGTERSGSGTVVDTGGLVVTVNYVVLGAETAEVTFLDGRTTCGVVVARDFFTGLAAIEVQGRSGPTARVGSSKEVAAGDDVFIVASASPTNPRINSGAVFDIGPFDAYWEYHLDRGIRTTAMNPGLGGGGLFSVRGDLIAVVALELGEIGRFTLGIPIEDLSATRRVGAASSLGASPTRRAWLGIFCYELHAHVIIGGLLPGSPAERGGLRPGDVILLVDGQKISERAGLYRCLWAHEPEEKIAFRVFREHAIREVQVLAADAEIFFA